MDGEAYEGRHNYWIGKVCKIGSVSPIHG